MYCSKCGNDVANGLTYCDVCGAELGGDAYDFDEPMNISPANDPGKTLGLVSMICGISSIVLSFSCCLQFIPVIGSLVSALSFLALPGGIAGLITGIIGSKKSSAYGCENGKAKIGIITSIASLVLGVISTIVIIIFFLAYFGLLGVAMSSGY